MALMGVVNYLELGDGADGRPLLRRVWKVEYIHESPWWRAQVDKQPYGPWSGDLGDHAGHVLADRVDLAGDFQVQFGRVMVGHRPPISTS